MFVYVTAGRDSIEKIYIARSVFSIVSFIDEFIFLKQHRQRT